METIIYQGRGIHAQKVNYLDGCLDIAALPKYDIHHQGEEVLFRDGDGNYYLRRWLVLIDVDGDTERRASGRVLVHRISLNAALLWATMRTSALTHDLRRDAWAALQAHEGPPQGAGHAHALTLDFTRNQWGMLGAAAKFDGMDRADWIMDQLRGDTLVVLTDCLGHDEARANVGWHREDEAGTENDAPVRLPAELDEASAALVRRYLEESPEDYTAAEVISGAVHYALSVAFEDLEWRRRLSPRQGVGLTDKGRRFADGGWGYVEMEIANVRQRRAGEREFDWDEPADDDGGQEKETATPTGRRTAGDPADVALLAAAEPEPFEELPPEQRGEPDDRADEAQNGKGGK